MSNKQLSIVIVNFKSEAYLGKCLASVYAKIKDDIGFEIILVNNDNAKKLDPIARTYPLVKIINPGKNIGFGAGNNRGVKRAQGDFILFLNPDTELESSNIKDVFSQFSDDSSLGVLGSRLVTASGETQEWSAGTEVSLWELVKNNFKLSGRKRIGEGGNSKRVDWVAGTSLFIKRENFIDVGGFDENFFMYFEDMDLCRKIREKGGKVLYYPGFSVKHWSGGSYSGAHRQKRDYYKSQEYYFKKHKGAAQYFIVKSLSFIAKYLLNINHRL